MDPDSSVNPKRVVVAALVGDAIITLMKFGIAFYINSTALLAEGFHSLADTANQVLLLLGLSLSSRPADSSHPFGYGKEAYFWAFVVSVSILTIGATFSVYEGIDKILHLEPLRHHGWGYLIIALSFVFESYSWWLAYRSLRGALVKKGFFRTIRESKSPATFIVFLEDSAAMIGLLVAFGGILLAKVLQNPLFDGVASIAIGILLALVALFVSRETRSLLIGEAVSREDLNKIKEAISSVPEVKEVMEILTMHLAPDDILVNLNINFVDDLTTDQVEEAIDKVERAIQKALPSVRKIFVEAESLRRLPR
ncbi:MAG: cation transporter [Deltaproteobacteria bacterium]|nr:MAG: cation transporter [Deltaproteobacteria bacterium]RLA97717.1 MAG: cation transporter [Deltaproteobacteria bacterium]